MRALLHLLRSNAHSPNVKQSCHLGQNTKPAKNAATAASFAHRGSGKDRKGRRRRRRTGVHVGRSIFRKQLRMAGWETEISHILSLIAITRSPLKKTRWVLIPFIQKDQTFIPKSNVPMIFQDSEAMMKSLKTVFKTTEHIFFHGNYTIPVDPLVMDKERVQMTAHDLWKATGYRFRYASYRRQKRELIIPNSFVTRVKENKALTTGHKTRYWCCQDQNRKQKSRPSQREGAKHRDTLGMHRYECKSRLNISCRRIVTHGNNTCTVTIWLEHHKRHTPYYDVTLPPEAAAMIGEDLEWTCPSQMAKKVLSVFPTVSHPQVHKAWTTMSETLWKRDAVQLPSVKALLSEYKDDAHLLNTPILEGVEQVAWVMRKIIGRLCGKIVEIGLDATCELTKL